MAKLALRGGNGRVRRYKPSLVNSPLLKGVEDCILTKLCMVMRPYLSIEGDQIVCEKDVGEEIYILITGCIKLSSETYPLYHHWRYWQSGSIVPAHKFHTRGLIGCDIPYDSIAHNIVLC